MVKTKLEKLYIGVKAQAGAASQNFQKICGNQQKIQEQNGGEIAKTCSLQHKKEKSLKSRKKYGSSERHVTMGRGKKKPKVDYIVTTAMGNVKRVRRKKRRKKAEQSKSSNSSHEPSYVSPANQ